MKGYYVWAYWMDNNGNRYYHVSKLEIHFDLIHSDYEDLLFDLIVARNFGAIKDYQVELRIA